MLARLLDVFRRRKRDYEPRHSSLRRPPPPPPPPRPVAVVSPARRTSPPPPPPPGAPAEAVEPHPVAAAAQELGGARVAFVRRDGSVVTPEFDAETAARLGYVVRSLLEEDEPVRRTT